MTGKLRMRPYYEFHVIFDAPFNLFTSDHDQTSLCQCAQQLYKKNLVISENTVEEKPNYQHNYHRMQLTVSPAN